MRLWGWKGPWLRPELCHLIPTAAFLFLRAQGIADLLQGCRVLDRGQVPGIAPFANGLYRPAQQLAAAGLGEQVDEMDARRPGHRAQLLVDQLHDVALQLEPGLVVSQG